MAAVTLRALKLVVRPYLPLGSRPKLPPPPGALCRPPGGRAPGDSDGELPTSDFVRARTPLPFAPLAPLPSLPTDARPAAGDASPGDSSASSSSASTRCDGGGDGALPSIHSFSSVSDTSPLWSVSTSRKIVSASTGSFTPAQQPQSRHTYACTG